MRSAATLLLLLTILVITDRHQISVLATKSSFVESVENAAITDLPVFKIFTGDDSFGVYLSNKIINTYWSIRTSDTYVAWWYFLLLTLPQEPAMVGWNNQIIVADGVVFSYRFEQPYATIYSPADIATSRLALAQVYVTKQMVYFTVVDPNWNCYIYETNGTAGSGRQSDIPLMIFWSNGATVTNPFGITVVDDILFFSLAMQPAYYTATTGLVNFTNPCTMDIMDGFPIGYNLNCINSLPYGYIMLQGEVYYWGNTGYGVNIWRSNMTANSGVKYCNTSTCNAGVLPNAVGTYLVYFSRDHSVLYSLPSPIASPTNSSMVSDKLLLNLTSYDQQLDVSTDFWFNINKTSTSNTIINTAYFVTVGSNNNTSSNHYNSHCFYLWWTNGITAKIDNSHCLADTWFSDPIPVDPINNFETLFNLFSSPTITFRNSTTKLSTLATNNGSKNQLFVSNFKAITFSRDNVTSYTSFLVQLVIGPSLQEAFSVSLAIYDPVVADWTMAAVNVCYLCDGSHDYVQVFPNYLWYFSQFGLRRIDFGVYISQQRNFASVVGPNYILMVTMIVVSAIITLTTG